MEFGLMEMALVAGVYVALCLGVAHVLAALIGGSLERRRKKKQATWDVVLEMYRCSGCRGAFAVPTCLKRAVTVCPFCDEEFDTNDVEELSTEEILGEFSGPFEEARDASA